LGARICEIPITSGTRFGGTSHYGLSRTFRVFFDLITIRFLLRYFSRPLHIFGIAGMAGILTGGVISLWMALDKMLRNADVMKVHGPLIIFATVLILGGVQLLGLGLLGEMQARQFYAPARHTPYAIASVLRSSEKAASNQ
jgi:hypothetical protein